ITSAPAFLKSPIDSLKACASAVQPEVKALGKKESTTGPFFSCSARWSLNSLPPTAPVVLKSGALSPTLSAAMAGVAKRLVAASVSKSLRMSGLLEELGACLLRRVQKCEGLLIAPGVKECGKIFGENTVRFELVEQR